MASFGKKLSLPLDSWTMARAALAYALVLPVRDRRGLEQMRETIEEEGGDSDDGDVVFSALIAEEGGSDDLIIAAAVPSPKMKKMQELFQFLLNLAL
ncbi:hypothetical protein MRB53_034620 [Persea americana]|uniref:Uncharacterized protein n=1 Tax=Persea americana TaxID=3435 RepID=A0ACC2K2B0_PERAE|nr:hypothetical protein MRB53_034620 [Persea americana]